VIMSGMSFPMAGNWQKTRNTLPPFPWQKKIPFELTATYPQAEPQTIAFAWRYTRNDSELEPLINLSGFDNTAVFKTLAALRKQEETYRLTLSVAMEGVLDWFASKSVCPGQ
jgi:hypothetical protein